jgi:hypothetical protein
MKTYPKVPNNENLVRLEAVSIHDQQQCGSGGLTGDARILCEGTVWRRIDDIVNNKMPVKIVAFNAVTGQFEPKPIIDWIKSPVDKKSLRKLSVTHPSGFKKCLYLSANQGVYTQRGIVLVDDLKPHDSLYMRSLAITEEGIQALIGMRLGDGSIRRHGKNCQKAVFTVSHCEKQRDYCSFIGEKFHVNCHDWISRAAKKSYAANQIAISLRVLWPDGIDILPPLKGVNDWMLERMDWQALAYWFMDDGTLRGSETPQFSSHAFNRDGVDQIIKCLREKFGIIGSWLERQPKGYGDINIVRASRDLFFRGIAPFIHPCLRYKIPQRYHAIAFLLDIKFVEHTPVPCHSSVRRVVGSSNIRHRVDDILRDGETYYNSGHFTPDFRHVYSLKIGDNFNFLAENVIVTSFGEECLS